MPADPGAPRIAALALCLAFAGTASMTYYHLGLFLPRALAASSAKGLGNGYAWGNDFYPIWLTTRQWRAAHRDPYSPQMTREIQAGLFGRPLDSSNPADPPVEYRQFAYPAFTDLIFWPAAAVEFSTLRLVLAILLPCLTALSIWLWMLALDWRVSRLWLAVIVILGLCNYPVLEAIFVEQPGLFVGFLLAASALALRGNRLLLAGVLLSLTLIKPQMALPAIAYLLLWGLSDRQRARFWAGFFLTTLFLVGMSLWVWPHWIGEWLRILRRYPRYATPPLVSLLPGAALGKYVGPVAIVGFLATGLALAWRNRRVSIGSTEFWLTLSLVLAIGSVTLLPGQAVYDHVILIPGILMLVRSRRELCTAGLLPRALVTLVGVALFWPWLAAFAVIAIRPWLPPAEFGSSAILALPIRTAGSLPFAVLALLICAARVKFPASQEPAEETSGS